MEAAELKEIEPLLPTCDVPVESRSAPLIPEKPESALRILT